MGDNFLLESYSLDLVDALFSGSWNHLLGISISVDINEYTKKGGSHLVVSDSLLLVLVGSKEDLPA